ncbi:MAG: hypothetical protein ACRBHB_06355 [Arenicella sp.]
MHNQNMEIKPEVQSFLDDSKSLGAINGGENWYITENWALRFHEHLNTLLLLAEQNDPMSQYQVACIYYLGYLYTSEKEAIENYESDIEKASYWFEKAAKNKVYSAIDNLIVVGVGEEADRLRVIYEEYKDRFPLKNPPSVEWENNLKSLYEIAYKSI